MAVGGQQNAKNVTLISSIRIFVDSKLGVISIGDQPSWNYIGVPPSKLLLKSCRKYLSIHD
ncbi:hypothetical protein BHE74_00011065 [Ensete ventricosum]|nr:hypothetical protein BHE74_00011065 [Ensete ventricosum]